MGPPEIIYSSINLKCFGVWKNPRLLYYSFSESFLPNFVGYDNVSFYILTYLETPR